MSFGKSSSKNSSKSQSTSMQSLVPANENAQLANVASAQNLLSSYKPYSGELVAPTNATEQSGYQSLLNVAANNPGASTLNSAVGATQGVANYTPQTVTAGQIANTNLSPYLNPYTSDVVNTTLADLQRQNQVANQSNDQQATAAGAFGGDRSAVLDALTNEAYARTGAQTEASLNQSNYSNAQTAAEQDIQSQLAAAQSNQQAGLTGANLNLQAGSQLGTLSNEQLSQGTTLANLIESVGQAQQQQQQNVDTANINQAQQTTANQQSFQSLINAALQALGNPTLTQSQSASQSSGGSSSIMGSYSSGGGK